MIELLNTFFLLQVSPSSGKWLTDTATAFEPKIIQSQPGGMWIHILLFSSFTMLVVLRVFDFRRLLLLVQGFARASSVATLYREESAIASRVSFFLLLNYLLMASLFVWHAMGVIFGSYPDPLNIVWIGVAIISAYIIKIVSTSVIGFLFEMRESAQEYIYNIILFNKTVGLVLFPIVLCLSYAQQIPQKWLVGAGIGCWAIVLIYRLLRLSVIGLAVRRVSLFYIILYLCTLEILPFVILVKAFVITK